jgi:hypothetical protein
MRVARCIGGIMTPKFLSVPNYQFEVHALAGGSYIVKLSVGSELPIGRNYARDFRAVRIARAHSAVDQKASHKKVCHYGCERRSDQQHKNPPLLPCNVEP